MPLAVISGPSILDCPKVICLLWAQVVERYVSLAHQPVQIILYRKAIGSVDEHKPVLANKVRNEHRLESQSADFHHVDKVNLPRDHYVVVDHIIPFLLVFKCPGLDVANNIFDDFKEFAVAHVVVQSLHSESFDHPKKLKLLTELAQKTKR